MFQAELCNLKVAAATQNVEGKTNKIALPYVQDKRQKSQRPTDPTEKKYNNKNCCWSQGYDTSETYTSETCTRTHAVHMKEATQVNPMGGSQNSKARLRIFYYEREAVDIPQNILQ